MLAFSWNVCLVACLVSQKRYECSQVQRYIRSAGRLYASNPSSIARRLFGHSNEPIGTAISCYFHILCPNLAAKVRVSIVVGYNVGRTWTNSKNRACWSETEHRVRKLLDDQSGYWSESFNSAGCSFRRTMAEYLLYMRVCRTAYRPFTSW
jgi:hypothetical protein